MSLTTDRNDPKLREGQKNETGQHDVYLVLSDEELAKGFVRPYRDKYVHVGRKVCGKIFDNKCQLGCMRKVCVESPNHEGDCEVFGQYDQPTHAKILETGLIDEGCGTVTTMGQKLSETYAREPKFYGATFCCGCNKHLPVAQFRWTLDDEIVGS